ncbi:SRPBCC family protein [Hyphococcus sp.]|jgi:uncharacterized protein YndB with AHSA1/START domain|uniref:SRPBCC family protein n=1 Tax=Hyphococcus sp. TaxID=2038636 RepID=UPI003D11B2E4
MKFDVERYLGAVDRKVVALEKDGKPARAVVLARNYDTSVEDLWDALTSPERLPRWFAPVTGDFKIGGAYQVKGNAGGTITECKPPELLALTWEMGPAVSWVEARVAEAGTGVSRLTLTHTAHVSPHWEQFGPGAVGVGWELGLLGLALYLENPDAEKPDENTFGMSPDGKAFSRGSANRWGDAEIDAGEKPEAAKTRAKNTGDFYTGETS